MKLDGSIQLAEVMDELKTRAVACTVKLSEEERKEYLRKIVYYLRGLDYYVAGIEQMIYSR